MHVAESCMNGAGQSPGWGTGTITDISGDPGVDGWVVGRVDAGLLARICDGAPAVGASDTAVDARPAPDEVAASPDPTP